MRDHAAELGPVALHFDQGPAKLGLLGSLDERLLEQTAEPILLPLNPEDVLNFLPSTCAGNLGVQSTRRMTSLRVRRLAFAST